jgi:hypothetical protein
MQRKNFYIHYIKGGINYGRMFSFLFMDVNNYDLGTADQLRTDDIHRNYTISDQVACKVVNEIN